MVQIHYLNKKRPCKKKKKKPRWHLKANFFLMTINDLHLVTKTHIAASSQSTTHDRNINGVFKKPESTEANSFFGYMFELFSEACFVMFLVTPHVW